MNATRQTLLLLTAAFLVPCRSVMAAPSATAPPAGTLPAVYRLTLPSASNGQIGTPASYSITFNLFNATPHTLYFAWAPYVEPALQFQVDHKGLGDNPNSDAGWKLVKPIPKPVSKSSPFAITEDHREKLIFVPGQEANFSAPLGFSLAAPGFYRISLTMTMDAYEKENPSDTKGQRRRIILQSDHLVVTKTDWGFVSMTERP